MNYLGEDIKKLGFGLMRLPQKDGKIDIEQTKKMVAEFLAPVLHILIPRGLMPAVRTPFARRWWSGIPGRLFSWRPKMPHGSIAKQGKRPLPNSIPL